MNEKGFLYLTLNSKALITLSLSQSLSHVYFFGSKEDKTMKNHRLKNALNSEFYTFLQNQKRSGYQKVCSINIKKNLTQTSTWSKKKRKKRNWYTKFSQIFIDWHKKTYRAYQRKHVKWWSCMHNICLLC